MKKTCLIYYLIFINIKLFAQWVPQESGTNDKLINIQFISPTIGWASSENKIYITINSGDDWTLQSNFTTEYLVEFQFISETTGWLITYENQTTRIYKTINGGTDWQLSLNLNTTLLTDINFINENVGWCVGTGGFESLPWVPVAFKTTDSGDNWESILVSSTYFLNFSSVDFINEMVGWIGGVGYLFNTSDGGKNWRQVLSPDFSAAITKVKFLDTIGWIATDYGGIFKTMDDGDNWIKQSAKAVDFFFLNKQIGWTVYDSLIYYTNDGGNIWHSQESNTFSFLWSIWFINEFNGWIAGDDGIVLYTNNAGTPVELMDFKAIAANDLVKIKWITATEINNKGFYIERKKFEENNWETLDFIEGAGTSTSINYYYYNDKILANGNYNYRLRQIDFDGSQSFSEVIEVRLSSMKFELYQNYPNPFNTNTIISFIANKNGIVKITIYNVLGEKNKELYNNFVKEGEKYEIIFSASDLTTGIYYYELIGDGYRDIKKMLYIK